MYKTAVIGLGNIGFGYDLDIKRKGVAGKGIKTHVSAYQKCSFTKLEGAVEIDNEAKSSFNSIFPNIPVYKSIDQLMSNHDIDFLSICTPSSNHYKTLMEVVKYPIKGILCEKPIALSLKDAHEMVTICKRKNILLTINHARRWHSNYLLAKEIIQTGEIGSIKAITAFYSGEIFNIGTHLFDAIRMLIDKYPILVSGLATPNASNKTDPSIFGWIQFEDDIQCVINTNGIRKDMVFEIDIIGTGGRIKVLNNGENVDKYVLQESEIYSGFRELVLTNLLSRDKQDVLFEAVCENINVFEGRKESDCSGIDGLISLNICFSLLKSSHMQGTPIKLTINE